jgi:LmbE family N-acetylglucosaminyl deacetylase
MMGVSLPGGPLAVVCLGAHPDDIEIGCGGTLLTLASSRRLTVDYLLMTGAEDRHEEARTAAGHFLAGADITYHLHDLPDGRLPGRWEEVKLQLEDVARNSHADLVLAPRVDDAHQDHRLIAQMVPTVWRDALILHYEIPKWDGDLGRVTHYVALDETIAHQKIDLLNRCFPSQVDRGWWDDETFRAILRLRGIECRNRYAEGFVVNKEVLRVHGGPEPEQS